MPPLTIKTKNTYIRLLEACDEAILQALCEHCSDYFMIVQDAPAQPNEGRDILTMLPEKKACSDKHVFGAFDSQTQNLLAVVDMIRDYPVQDEWIIGLMMIKPSSRQKGLGKEIYDALASWCKKNGAIHLGLGVLEGNPRALHFWQTLGFSEVERKTHTHKNKTQGLIVMRNKL